jgi:hypothetical protein
MSELLALPLDHRFDRRPGPGSGPAPHAEPGSHLGTTSEPGPEAGSTGDPHRLHRAACRMAGRLAVLMARLEGTDAPAVDFLVSLAAAGGADPVDGSVLDLPRAGQLDPVDRAMARLALDPIDVDLLVLAGLADEHEGLAAVCRELHPEHRPVATTGLAAGLADHGLLGPADRALVRHHLHHGPLVRHGLVMIDGGGPFWEAGLRPGPGLWSALRGEPTIVAGTRALALPAAPWGLEGWLARSGPRAAAEALRRQAGVVVVLGHDRPGAGAARLAALADAAGQSVRAVRMVPGADPDAVGLVALHAMVGGQVPLLELADPALDLTGLALDWPLLVSIGGAATVAAWPRPVLRVHLDALDRHQRREALVGALPELADHPAPVGPATVEPAELAELAVDLRAGAALRAGARSRDGARPGPDEERPLADRVADALDHHRAHQVPPGAVLVRPRARWEDLVLADEPAAQLAEAAARLAQAEVVIDQWGFLAGRAGGRGLRLLFCGPPGTGKTLATEVLAASLGRDLLVVDLSRMVSKWVGETEKNLAATFEAAETTGSALLFDEADALFGRRTEVGDARDRYANLETAYLLARIERFEGLVVLATNLRQNLDAAFARRLEFIVSFDPPDAGLRARLWRRHLPATAPVDPDLDLDDVAARYPLSGGLIRNAAVAAAFLAAADGSPITADHVVHAVRREFAKAGQNFPGPPPPRAGSSPPASPSAKEWPCPHPQP